MASKRVAWVVSHPIQYQVPVFRHLDAMDDVDFTVLYLSPFGTRPSKDPGFGVTFEWDVPLLSGYRWRLVEGHRDKAPGGFFSIFASGIGAELRRGGYDVIVANGYNYAGTVYAIWQAHRLGQQVVLLSDSNLEEHTRSLAKRAAKRAFFRWLFRPDDHGLATGVRSRRYLEYVGIAPERIHPYPHCVDTSLTDDAWKKRAQLRQERRRELRIPEDAVVFLYAGKLIDKKDPLGVIRAFRELRGDPHLLVVGSGDLEAPARALAGDDAAIHFLGFQNQTKLPAFYAASDVLVLPSKYEESWGLVVNEALAMGCAVIVSDRVGACPDLVEGRDTGIVVPPDDAAALRGAMQRAVDDDAALARWRDNARPAVSGNTPRHCAQGVRAAAWSP